MFFKILVTMLFVQSSVALSAVEMVEMVKTARGDRATGYLGLGDHSKLQYFNKELKGSTPLPETFDWRTSGVVTPVKDQGNCGSCWSFGMTKALESALAIYTSRQGLNLSEQQMVSCVRGDAYGCSGGYMTAASYLVSKGLTSEDKMPYTASNGRCKAVDVIAKAADYKLLGSANRKPSVDEIKTALIEFGPLFVTVKAGGSGWSGSTGKVTSCRRTSATNHIVTLIAYDKTGFIFRNSWGEDWGDHGDSWIGFGCDGFASEAGAVIIDHAIMK